MLTHTVLYTYILCHICNVTLVSQGMLDDQGYKFTTNNGMFSCYNKRGVLKWNAFKREGLYHFDHFVERCMMSKDETHVKFGHANESVLDRLGDFEGELSFLTILCTN